MRLIELDKLIDSVTKTGELSSNDKEMLVKRAKESGVSIDFLERRINLKLRMHQPLQQIRNKDQRERMDVQNSTGLIPHELDLLIKEFLIDGVLTSKEREVVLRKAEKMGLDRDEIDLYLDAQVQKIEQETDTVIRRQKGKACPYCGSPVPQLADKCPECGQFITPEASKELQEILDNLEEALVKFKSGRSIDENKATAERYVRKAKMYYGSNPKIIILLQEVEKEILLAESKAKKQALINGTLKNKWFWGAMPIVIALISFLIAICLNTRTHEDLQAGLLILSFVSFVGGIYSLLIVGQMT